MASLEKIEQAMRVLAKKDNRIVLSMEFLAETQCWAVMIADESKVLGDRRIATSIGQAWLDDALREVKEQLLQKLPED